MMSSLPRGLGGPYARFALGSLMGCLLACLSLSLKWEWITNVLQRSSQTFVCADSTAYARAKAGNVGVSEPPSDKKHFIYAYENNPKTGSTSWDAELTRATAASKNFDMFSCDSNKIANSLAVASFAVENRSLFLSCPMRRVVFAQRPDVRLITSFFLEKELVFSNYLEERDLNLSSDLDAMADRVEDYNLFLEKFQINWQINYFGYTAYKEEPYRKFLTCPISSTMQQFVDIAAEDTFLPISHDLPCVSRKLLWNIAGIDVMDGVPRLNVRDSNSSRPLTQEKETDLSCIDEALAKALALKLVRLFEGRDSLDIPPGDWKSVVRGVEEKCQQQQNRVQ